MDNAVVEGILIEYHLIAQRIKLFSVNIPYLNPQMAHNAKLALWRLLCGTETVKNQEFKLKYNEINLSKVKNVKP
mgnify:CR=1 FL=1